MSSNPDDDFQPALVVTSDAQLAKALLIHPDIKSAYDQLKEKSSPANVEALKQAVMSQMGIESNVAGQYVRSLKMVINNEMNPPSQRR